MIHGKRIWLVAIVALACMTWAGAQTPKRPVLIRIAASGDPLKLGEQAGQMCGERLREVHPVMLKTAEALKSIKKYSLYAQASKLSLHLTEDHIREMRGIALGSGLSYQDILFLNMFYFLIETKMSCRQLAAWGDAAADGAMIHGRNLDWYDYQGDPLKQNNVIANIKPEGKTELLSITWPGLVGVLTGTNREGLTVGYNRLTDGRREYRLAEPVFFTLRRVLEKCATLQEAIEVIEHAEPLGNGSILISSVRDKSAVVMELVDGQIGIRRPSGPMICNANHATAEAGLKMVRMRPADQPMGKVVDRIGLPLNARKMRSVLSAPEVLLEMNIVSVIFEPESNRMHLACGVERAARARFQTHVLFPDKTPGLPEVKAQGE